MKKTLLLISLITVLSSCGGGGGGSSQTSQATPTAPHSTQPSQNPDQITGNIGSNESSSIGQNTGNIGGTNNGNNNGQVVQPQNPASEPQTPTVDNRFPKPVDSREITGQGVKVGVLDSDFLSGKNAKTENFHIKVINSFGIGDTFDKVIEEEFGDRMTTLVKNNTKSTDKSDHGLIVATILAGNNGKGAKKSEVYGASISNGPAYQVDIEYYRQMYNNGVRIYNQSLGHENIQFDNPQGIYIAPDKTNEFDYKKQFQQTVYIPDGSYSEEQLKNKADEIIKFYEEAIENGSLFVWAAGNKPLYGVDFEAAEDIKTDKKKEKEVFVQITPVLQKMASIVKKYIKDYKVKDVYLVGGACSFDESEEIFKKELGLNIYKPYMPVYITPLGIALAGMKE